MKEVTNSDWLRDAVTDIRHLSKYVTIGLDDLSPKGVENKLYHRILNTGQFILQYHDANLAIGRYILQATGAPIELFSKAMTDAQYATFRRWESDTE